MLDLHLTGRLDQSDRRPATEFSSKFELTEIGRAASVRGKRRAERSVYGQADRRIATVGQAVRVGAADNIQREVVLVLTDGRLFDLAYGGVKISTRGDQWTRKPHALAAKSGRRQCGFGGAKKRGHQGPKASRCSPEGKEVGFKVLAAEV